MSDDKQKPQPKQTPQPRPNTPSPKPNNIPVRKAPDYIPESVEPDKPWPKK